MLRTPSALSVPDTPSPSSPPLSLLFLSARPRPSRVITHPRTKQYFAPINPMSCWAMAAYARCARPPPLATATRGFARFSATRTPARRAALSSSKTESWGLPLIRLVSCDHVSPRHRSEGYLSKTRRKNLRGIPPSPEKPAGNLPDQNTQLVSGKARRKCAGSKHEKKGPRKGRRRRAGAKLQKKRRDPKK